MPSPLTSPGVSGPNALTRFRAPVPGERIDKNWRGIQNVAKALATLSTGLQSVRSQLDAFIKRSLKPNYLAFHPFKIYQLPQTHRDTPAPSTDWLKFRVRAGRVIVSDVTAVDVSGTGMDGYNLDPDSDFIPTVSVTDITVSSGVEAHWFWIELSTSGSSPTATLKNGATPTSAGWTSFPNLDGLHIPIGFVDTDTDSDNQQAIIRQLLRTDLIGISC